MSSIFLATCLDKYMKTGSSSGSRGSGRLTLSCILLKCWKACMLYGNSGILMQSNCSGFWRDKRFHIYIIFRADIFAFQSYVCALIQIQVP